MNSPVPELPLLSVDGLHKTFGLRQAVKGVSFTVSAGETLGLIGPNGAGKSTTVGLVCGLLQPDQGEVRIQGQRMGPGTSAAKRVLGLVPQDLALIEDLPARENLRLFGALYGLRGAALAERCEEVLDLVQLGDRANDLPRTYSGGMKRRLNIAAALLHDPQLLVLDEPTVGVDPQSRNAIFDSLEALKRQGRALIYTSHYMEEVERLADRILIIDHGQVVADDTPAGLYQRLPARAALQVQLLAPLPDEVLAGLWRLPGVAGVAQAGLDLDVALRDSEQALPVVGWLAAQGAQARQFATARSNLESVFLTLTGRTLRDH